MKQVSRYSKLGVLASRVLSLAVVLYGCASETNSLSVPDSSQQPPSPAPAPSPSPAPGDSAPPAISLTAPAAGNVSGTFTVSANASDNVAVVGVQFRLNGSNLGNEDTSVPYSVSWNTTSLTPGTTYTLSAVARDAVGLTTTSSSVTVQAPPPVPQGLIFFDNFEYAVGRNDSNAANLFQLSGFWNGAKTEQSNSSGANGFLYTATSIPGYSGAFPGNASSRVLVMEALPNSEGAQTDFYLQYGNGEDAAYDNAIPGDVWFQFWVYVNHYGSQMSSFDTGKFIYACNAAYPCHTHKWMMTLSGRSAEPFWQDLGSPTDGSAFMNNTANTLYPVKNPVSSIVNTRADTGNEWKLGHTNPAEHFSANRWTLVKIHLDTSTQSGRYEAWMRPLGGSWIKTAEWISGVTPGFTWTINASHVGGHRVFRMPTTIGSASGGLSYDTWIYLDDFAMASSEGALPQYP